MEIFLYSLVNEALFEARETYFQHPCKQRNPCLERTVPTMAFIVFMVFIMLVGCYLVLGWFGFKAVDERLNQTNFGIFQSIGYHFKEKAAPRYTVVRAKNPTWEQKAQETALDIYENKLKGKDAQKRWDEARFDFPCGSCRYQIPEGDPIPDNCEVIETGVLRRDLD